MPNLTEELKYTPGIYRWETTDPIIGGEPAFDGSGNPTGAGLDNVPTKQLADRTKYLKAFTEQFGREVVQNGLLQSFQNSVITVADADDFNDMVLPGTYVGSGLNAPISDLGTLFVTATEGDFGSGAAVLVNQMFVTPNGIFFRKRSLPPGSDTWSAWAVYEPTSIVAPAGAVQAFARNTAPAGWLKANGAAISRTTYARLFEAIGTDFGFGDGSTTFNVPDFRGEFMRGWDDGRGVDAGRSWSTAQADEFKSHVHGYGSMQINEGSGGIQAVGGGSPNNFALTAASGGSETRPRNITVLYCIKF
jgi:microcystin-dependent protein